MKSPRGPAMGGLVTLQDLAVHCGLAKSTVSLALSGRGTISAKTRERVRAAAAEIGYRPDPLLAALAGRRFKRGHRDVSVAFVTTEPEWQCREILEGAKGLGRRMGYGLRFEPCLEVSGMPSLLRRLFHEGFSGVIFHHVPPGGWLESGHLSKLALVQCRMGQVALPMSTVRSGILAKTHEVYSRVLEAGYRRVGSILTLSGPDGSHLEDQARVGGVLGAEFRFRDRCEFVPPLVLHPLTESGEDCRARARRWLAEHRPPAMVLTHSGLSRMLFYGMKPLPAMAYTLLKAEDAAGDAFAGMLDNNPEIGERCIELIDQLLRSNRFGILKAPHEVVIPSTWKPGQSLPPAPKTSKGRRSR